VFIPCIVAGVAHVALSIPGLVAAEVIELPIPTLRQWSSVSVMGVKTVIDVAIKAVMAVKPGTGSYEDPA
jgi:hypothetical protein